MGRVEGKVALVTGACRGQGRSHAVLLAQQGADVVVTDVEAENTELQETARLVEAEGRRAVAATADIRSFEEVQAVADAGFQAFGKIDIVAANAGIANYAKAWDMTEEQWDLVMDVNVKGVWHTCKAVLPRMISAGNGGSIVITGSTTSERGLIGLSHYAASKHGVLGFARSLANELGEHMIRVNLVHPSAVNTPLMNRPAVYKRMLPHMENPTREDYERASAARHILPVGWVDPIDISHAVLWLASDESRYVTGVAIPVDAGMIQKGVGQ